LTLGARMAGQRSDDDWALVKIFETMVEDAVKRRAKGGKGSHTLPGAVHGYLEFLSQFIGRRCRPPDGPPAA
jgi:hypothetical protein